MVDFDLLSKLFESLVLNSSDLKFPLIGEGTFMKFTAGSKWAHVKIKIETNDVNKITISNNLTHFPKLYLDETENTLIAFTEYYKLRYNEDKKWKFEILDATFHEYETGRKNFYYATRNAIQNAFDKSIHAPDLEKVYRYKNSFNI